MNENNVEVSQQEESFFADVEINLDFEDLTSSEMDELKGMDITDAISGKVVKDVILKKEEGVKDRACIIDYTGFDDVTEESYQAIKNMLVGGEYKVYTKDGKDLLAIGSTTEEYAIELLPMLINAMYNKKVKVFIRQNGKVRKFNRNDINLVRIQLR